MKQESIFLESTSMVGSNGNDGTIEVYNLLEL